MDPVSAAGGVVAGGLLATLTSAYLARRRKQERAGLRAEAQLLEGELTRILEALTLAEDSAKRLLQPRELEETAGRITHELVSLLGVRGASLYLNLPDVADEPIRISAGERIESGEDGPADGPPPPPAGSILALPIRFQDTVLGELRVAEQTDRSLTTREIQIARLLAQLVGIAAEHTIQRNRLVHAEEDKRRFIMATTHDLRAPLQTIRQLIQALLDGYAGAMDAKVRETLGRVDRQADQLLDLVSDLLNLAIEEQVTGWMRPLVSVSLTAVFDLQVEATRIACEAKGIRLTVGRPDAPLLRRAAEGDVEKIFANLLSNAVKYTPPGGAIEAAIEDGPSGVLFRVRDTGIGIPADSLPRLFTEYYRAPNAKQVERHGTGLGLALVQKLVRKYGGKIRIESTERCGTVVEILLPPEEETFAETWSGNER
jgi:signal transduction histidine kinase